MKRDAFILRVLEADAEEIVLNGNIKRRAQSFLQCLSGILIRLSKPNTIDVGDSFTLGDGQQRI